LPACAIKRELGMRPDLLDQYERQVELEYQGEKYAVRDNGAVCRIGRPGRRRTLDGVWTFGRPSASNGYMRVGSHVVHRIVALAFHEQPSKQHIVDHIDTNRRNNRADNLRWVTRLENVLLNPISLARLIRCYGSMNAFFEDPSAMQESGSDFGWMRTVTKEEADESRRRLLEWASSGKLPKGGQLGEWVFQSRRAGIAPPEMALDIQSATPMAIQRNWRTRSEFPACPDSLTSDPLGVYAERLKPEAVFSRSAFGETITEVAGRTPALLAVVGRMPDGSVKGWAVSVITVESGKFVHESKGTFVSLEGALNAFSKLLGVDPPYEETIDDFR
jgi:hypothetical protein